jgi:glutamate synthase (NADPH) large chain
MSLKTRFGNLKNVLDESSSQTEILVLESPFIANAEFDVMPCASSARGRWLHRLHLPAGGGDEALRAGLERIRAEAEDAVRSGAGHLVLTDERQGEGQGRDADDPGHQRGAFLADAQGAADLLLAQRALGRMHRPALFRRADRLRRDDGEPYLAQDSIADRIGAG